MQSLYQRLRYTAPVRSKGGQTEWVHWGTGTAHLLPRLLRLPDGTSRTSGPVFLANRKPTPARQPLPRDICPHTGRPRLGYDRTRVLLHAYTGWRPHQLRHSAATHLGEKKVPLQLIMAKTRHRSPRTAIRPPRRRRSRRGHRAAEPAQAGAIDTPDAPGPVRSARQPGGSQALVRSV
jgi:integrase